MKHIATPALIFLAACTAAPDYSLISDDGPQDKLTRPEPRPERLQNVCPPKSPYAGKPVKEGHEYALCYGETPERTPEPKEPETECSYNGWQPGVRYALDQKACA